MLSILLATLENDQDRERFLQIHDALENRLYYLAMNYLKNPSGAEDVVQETWIQVILNFKKLSVMPWEEAQAYILAIARNISLNILRRDKRLSPLPEDWDVPAPETRSDRFHRLVELIRSMPDGYREILELKLVLEWSNKKIARALDMKESSVATRIQRGREKLIKVLREEGY